MYILNVKRWAYCLFLMMCFSPLRLMAEDIKKMVISKNDGTEVSFLLSENPRITFFRNYHYEYCSNMKITTISHEMELSTIDLNKMAIESVSVTGIINLVSEKDAVFSWQGDALYIEVMEGHTIIVVYDSGGKIILFKSLDRGKHALSLSDLPKGVNIIKINDEILKIWNR